jgi:hypothetical protein
MKHPRQVWGLSLLVLSAVVLGGSFDEVSATHEADHRFTIKGNVCGADGKPRAELQVHVKNTRVDVRASTYTDQSGFYKTTLHLHNDNVGDTLVIYAGDEEKEAKIQFDPKDLETERSVTVDFGSGCLSAGGGTAPWVYYAGGVGLVGLVVVIGASWNKRRKHNQLRKSGTKKKQRT